MRIQPARQPVPPTRPSAPPWTRHVQCCEEGLPLGFSHDFLQCQSMDHAQVLSDWQNGRRLIRSLDTCINTASYTTKHPGTSMIRDPLPYESAKLDGKGSSVIVVCPRSSLKLAMSMQCPKLLITQQLCTTAPASKAHLAIRQLSAPTCRHAAKTQISGLPSQPWLS